MSTVCVPVPDFGANHTIGVEITLDGKKHVMNYRVETFALSETLAPESRVEQLRSYIHNYEPGWELVRIGPAGGSGLVPVTFRQRVIA